MSIGQELLKIAGGVQVIMPSYLRRAFVLPLTWKSPTALQSKSDTVSDSPALQVHLHQRQLWKKTGCWVRILVVENDVGLPDHLGRNTESLNAVIFRGVPTQFIIIPDLQEIGVSLKNSSLTSNMLVLYWVNIFLKNQSFQLILPFALNLLCRFCNKPIILLSFTIRSGLLLEIEYGPLNVEMQETLV